MPQQSKAQFARLRVGLLAVAAMIIIAILVFLITGTANPFSTKTDVFTYMNDAATLAQGAPVNLNGIPIGKVKSVTISGNKDPQRIIRIDMEIPAHQLSSIPMDSIASISAANVLGTKFINIKMGKSAQSVRPGGEVQSLNTAEFEDVVQQGYTVLSSLQAIVNKANQVIDQIVSGHGSIGKLLVDETLYNHLMQIVDSVQQLTNALNSPKGTLGKVIYDPELYNQVKGSLDRVDSLLKDLEGGQGTAGKLLKDPALYNDSQKTINDVDQVVKQLHQLTADLNAGKGTAGKLLKSDELHRQVLVTLGKVDTVMDKLNAGQGTIGQLLVNQQLYDNLNGSTRELQGLLKDFRANPKKFLRIKLGLF
ncbi:MAG: MCE family protein [Acidobacteriaceae bacterium]|nr:MCE family protein [Acidobacteriaceae bacterium]